MKTDRKLFLVWWAVLAVWAALPCRAGVTLSVSPPVVGNLNPGVITLSIGGIPAGAQVTVDRFLDVNGSGVFQTNDLLLDAFKITDNGGPSVIDGVTNSNVAFDDNSAPGAISTTLNLAPPRVLNNLVGNFLYKISSPTKAFSSVTTPCVITNTSAGQSVAGIIYSNGLTPLPGGVVVALTVPGGQYAGAAVADSGGNYRLSLNPGTYGILPLTPGYFTDTALAPVVNLTNGVTATNHLSLTNGLIAIAGSVSDLSGNSLGGVLLTLKSGSLMAIALTGTNGEYSAAVTPAVWKVKADSGHLAERAYVVPQNALLVDATGGGVTGQNIIPTKTTALFYGTVTNLNGTPFANVSLTAQDESGLYAARGFSDPNGNYVIAIPGGSDYWNWSPDSSSLPPAAYLISIGTSTSSGATAFPATGQAAAQNFTVIPADAQISGQLQDSSGLPLTGVGINVSATLDGLVFNAYEDTDDNGDYSLAAVPGVWTVGVNCCGNDGLSTLYGLTVTNFPMVTVPPTNVIVNLTAYLVEPLQITTTSLPNAVIGLPYSVELQYAGGFGPYSWGVPPSLPQGLALVNASGLISGTPPDGAAGTYYLPVTLSDGSGLSVTQSLTLVVVTTNQTQTGPLLIAPADNVGGAFQFSFQSASQAWYTVECSSNLTTWNVLGSFQSPGGVMPLLNTNTAASPARFYRVKSGR